MPDALALLSNMQVRVDDKGASNEIWLDVMGKHHGHDGKLCLQVPPQEVEINLTGVP